MITRTKRHASGARASRSAAGALVGAVAAMLLGAGGCAQEGSYYTCANPAKGTGDPCPDPAPDAGAEPVEDCSGQCVPKTPLGWSEPALLWFGPPEEAPECPESAPILGYEGYADLGETPNLCPTCSCGPAEATCALPLDWAAHAAPLCQQAAVETSFGAPAGWDGSCTAVNAIPPGQLCNGQPCVQSLSIAPPTVMMAPCTPMVDGPPAAHDLTYPWGIFARACVGAAYPPCKTPANVCAPAPPSPETPPPSGFLTCTFHEGERSCPMEYPARFVFYAGVEDTRSCSECACGEPEGASCTVLAGAFSDGACSAPVTGQNMISSAAPFCASVVPGSGLGSKSAAVVDVNAGSCPPLGGEPIGEVVPAGPATFCCGPG